MLKIKEWKYNEMMKKVCSYGDKWEDINNWERDADNFDTVKVIDGFVNYSGRYEVLKETEKAVQINFNLSWTEWFPKSTIIM